MYRYRDTEHIDITPVTKTGGIVTIDNADDVISIQELVADIEPIQSGSGTPSPNNVRPISGHTDVVVSRTGKNLLPSVTSQIAGSGITATWQTDGTLKLTGTASGNVFVGIAFSIKAGSYVLSGCPSGGGDNTYQLDIRSRVGSGVLYSRDIGSGLSFSPSADLTAYVNIRVANGYACPSGGLIVKPMIRLATDSADFEPYQGDTYTTALGTTVYGGTLDVTTGVLTVDRAIVTYDGSNDEVWQYYSVAQGNLFRITQSDRKAGEIYPLGAYCNRFEVVRNADRTNGTMSSPTSGSEYAIDFIYDACTTEAQWRTWLSSNNVQVVYPLATPTTTTLTAQEISTLLGQNNVWASSGNIKVVYAVDLKKYVTLPKEAVSINGTYIEKILDGYSTLYVKGRESLGVELNTYSVGTANGEKVKGKRYPARVLTVGFQLLADNETEFRQRFNQLNNLLSLDEADFVFNDEQDKYFTGYAVMDASVEAGRNNVTGEWKIYCAYPFKRSVDVKTLSSTDASGVVVSGTSATFTFDYKGTQPARPILRAEFASAKSGGDYTEDGDCGFVAFLDPDENIIQLGNPDVINVDALNKNATLANSVFDAFTGWTNSGLTIADITDTYWENGTGQTQKYAKGTGTLTRTTTGAIGFEFDIVHRLCVDAPAQTGSFKLHLKNGANVIVGFEIEKTGNGTAGTVKYILNDKVVGTDTVDLSYYNTNFGYCNRTPVYVNETYYTQVVTYVKKKKKKKKKVVTYVPNTRAVQTGWNYTQSNLNSGISRDGGVVTFSIGGLADRTFKDSDIETTSVTTVLFTTTGNFHTNALRSCAFVSKKGVPFADIPNVFTAGDIVEADCNDANVYLYRNGSADGHLEAQYGALGNDWEDFELKVGQNVIRAVWSSWVNASYKPVIKIIFNEVYI